MPVYTLETFQKLPVNINGVWNFISSPHNLKLITPEHMGFEVTTKNLPDKMYPGMIISYIVKPLFGIKMKWVTEITHVKEPEYFVDEQRIGPYKFWHHQHRLSPISGGVLMTDIVNYKPPLGFIGGTANLFIIRKQLNNIFEFRKKRLEELFGIFS